MDSQDTNLDPDQNQDQNRDQDQDQDLDTPQSLILDDLELDNHHLSQQQQHQPCDNNDDDDDTGIDANEDPEATHSTQENVDADANEHAATDEDEDHDEDEDEDANEDEIDLLNQHMKDWQEESEPYEMFEKEMVSSILCYYIYMCPNKDNKSYSIVDVKSNIIEFINDDSTLESNILMSLIKNNEVHKCHRFKLFKLLRYNLTIESDEIEKCVRNHKNCDISSYFKEIDGFPDIQFDDTIEMYDDQNALYIFYVQDQKKQIRSGNLSRRGLKRNKRATTRKT